MAEATATKTEEIQGTTILTTKEPEKPSPEAALFKQPNPVEEAKANAIKELQDKTAAEAATKAEAEKKAATDTKPTETVTKPAEKAVTSTQTDYTLNLPENSVLTKEDLDSTLKEAKEAGLNEDEAKELLQSKEQVAKISTSRLIQKQNEEFKTLVGSWKEAVNKDPQLGGEHLAETAIKSSRAAKVIFDIPTLKFLEDTGYANHPGLVRAMVKVYDLIGEDKFVHGSVGGVSNTPTTTEEKAKKLFGNPIKQA